MRGSLAQMGLVLVVPPNRAVSLLYLTYEQESLRALLLGRPLGSARTREALLEVFRSLVEPAAR